jgi:hypothetical protein
MCVQTVRKSKDGKAIMVVRNNRFNVSVRDSRGDWIRKLEQVTLSEANAFMDRT